VSRQDFEVREFSSAGWSTAEALPADVGGVTGTTVAFFSGFRPPEVAVETGMDCGVR